MSMDARPRILIADNDSSVSALLAEVLRASGLEPEVVGDGEAALARLHAASFRLLVCDLDMPRMDGHTVLERMAELASAPPVLIVTGYLDPRHEARLRAMPQVRAVFHKPFDVLAFAAHARDLALGTGLQEAGAS